MSCKTRKAPPAAAFAMLAIGLLLFFVASPGCSGDNRPTVVLYVSADEHVARKVIEAFEKKHNIRVLMVGDTEVKKTAGLVDRLRAEKDKPQADVFWSSEVFMTIDLADEGVLEPFESAVTKDWPAQFKDAQNRWHGMAGRARVIVYSPDRVPADAVPDSWMDLTDSRFRGRIVMADPRFGTTGGHLGAMKAFWTREIMPGYYEAFLEGLADNQVRMLASGNAGVVEAVANGEADLGMTDTDDVWAAQANGRKVELVYPVHSVEPGATGVGTLLIPNTVAKIKGAPHSREAAVLIDFLLSEEVERMLAESVSHNVPLRSSLAAEFPRYKVPDPLRVDFAMAAKLRTKAINQAMDWLDRPRPVPSTQASQPQSQPQSRPDEHITPLKDGEPLDAQEPSNAR